jgi:hypothetical protein
MSDHVVTVRLSPSQAAFLQANLALMATNTRQAMARPGLEPERHMALTSRALVLERTEDAVRGAMLDVPGNTRKSDRNGEPVARPHARGQVQEFGRSPAGATARSRSFR